MKREKKWWSISAAARYSGLPEQLLRCKMQAHVQGRAPDFDIGLAVKNEGSSRWVYYVFPSRFKAWLGDQGFPVEEMTAP